MSRHKYLWHKKSSVTKLQSYRTSRHKIKTLTKLFWATKHVISKRTVTIKLLLIIIVQLLHELAEFYCVYVTLDGSNAQLIHGLEEFCCV
jgi:hypothetical protein